MASPNDCAYNAPEISQLLIALEEATRATPEGGPGVFVPPAGGELDQAMANFHHFVFGRRGSGKTTLLRYIERKLKDEGRATVWIDQELFMALSYPDVLVSSVLAVMEGVRTTVSNAGELPRSTSGFRDRMRARRERREVTERRQELLSRLDQVISNLSVLKFAPQNRTIEWTRTVGAENATEALGSVKVGHGPVAVDAGAKSSEKQSNEVISSETTKAPRRSIWSGALPTSERFSSTQTMKLAEALYSSTSSTE